MAVGNEEEKPIYLIAGFPRSGTSALMRALDAGGLPAVHDADYGRLPSADPTYDPNPHGYYELRNREHKPEYAGRVVKCLNRQMLDVLNPVFRYRAVYLMRDPAEIKRSYARTVPNGRRDFSNYGRDVLNDVRLLEGFGADVVLLKYRDVIDDPYRELSKLTGWPFDVAAAAATIDPALYRHRC